MLPRPATRGFTSLRLTFNTGIRIAVTDFVRQSLSLLDAADKSSEAVAREILGYFLRNPEAADSLTGIARWRLLEEAVQRSVARTEAALQWLLEQGYLRQVQMRGTEGIFCLNPEKRTEAELFLEQKQRKE
jgi:hypothetical protein